MTQKPLYEVTGQHPIRVVSGEFSPGATHVELTVAEAAFLSRTRAVTPMAAPAKVAGASAQETSGLSETKPSHGRKGRVEESHAEAGH